MPSYYLNTLRYLMTENVFSKPLVVTALDRFTIRPTNEEAYNNAVTALIASTNLCTEFTSNNGYEARILGTVADGTVFFDSSRLFRNTFENFQTKTINENHASRSAIRQAMDNQQGTGWERKHSTSIDVEEEAYAVRTGQSVNDIGLVIRITISEIPIPL